jgi:hypothetical protein
MKKLNFFLLSQIVFIILMVSPALSKTSLDVAKDFLKAAKSADFRKLAELSCKDSGPYLTPQEAQKLDLSDVGAIQEIIREEKSEFDTKGLRIVVARLKIFGSMVFGCFYVFETDKGWKASTLIITDPFVLI